MDLFRQLFEFAAKAGAFEGYVYHNDRVDVKYLPGWSQNLKKAYELLPENVRSSIQPSLDETLGRATRSVIKILGREHEVVRTLLSMIKSEVPESPLEFEEKKRWFE
ncbi:MAG: hypothetical protein N2513_08680 [Deltaproteobacteria bacterium]|nr:hypothetical protein [Deltaproteobacteria bacterium]